MTPGPPGEAVNEPKQTNGMDERDEHKKQPQKRPATGRRLRRRHSTLCSTSTAPRLSRAAKRQRAMTSVVQSLHVEVT